MGLQVEKKGEYIKTRTWKTKKGIKTKQYVYQKQSTLLFRKTTKGGETTYKLIKKAWDEFEDKIRREITNPAEMTSTLNEARRIRNDILAGNTLQVAATKGNKKYQSARQKGWNRIDINSMISRISMDKAAKFLINMGLQPAEVADRFDIDLMDLLDEGKWIQDTWSGYTRNGTPLTLKFHFDYNYDTNIEVL